jgi:hypothetical protein
VITPVSITPQPLTDGIVYCRAVPLTPQEAALGDALVAPALIPIVEGQTIVAVVKLSVNGYITGNSAFVFLQTDLGDGTWVDLAWCYYNQTQAPAMFVLAAGGLGAMNAAFQQARNPSSAPNPQASGSNACPLGGRCRFSGFATAIGGSSSAPGVSTVVSATVTYKLQQPR